MKKRPLSILVAALALVLVAHGGASAQTKSSATSPSDFKDQIMTVKLAELNNSGVYGGARITYVSDTESRVEITTIANSSSVPMPAHIHKGSCANLDPVPAFPLNNVVNSASDTTVPVSMLDLAKGGYAINIHKSATEASVYVACGDIEPFTPASPSGPPVGFGGSGQPGMPSTGSGEPVRSALFVLILLALCATAGGVVLARRRA
jgi:hypothetical protein